jgi:hypothetical protein
MTSQKRMLKLRNGMKNKKKAPEKKKNRMTNKKRVARQNPKRSKR